VRAAEKSTWWGTERNAERRQLRRSSGRLKGKSLVQPIWPGRLKEERGTMACSMTRVRWMTSLGMAFPRGDTTRSSTHDAQQRRTDSGTGHDQSVRKCDEDITSMDTTSPIRWSWSSTYFQPVGKHQLETVFTASYGFQFGSSTTLWKDHQVYFETDPASCGYLIRVGYNH
jgi:hypothetical protein